MSQTELAAVRAREQAAVDARAVRYRTRRPRQPLDGRVAVVVDDGIATGSTARAACQIARAAGAARVVLAVPVAPPGWQARIGADADELACVGTPRGFFAIGQFYARFPQVSDDEVIACLDRAAGPQSPAQASTAPAAGTGDPPARSEEVQPTAGAVRLAGYLTVPQNPLWSRSEEERYGILCQARGRAARGEGSPARACPVRAGDGHRGASSLSRCPGIVGCAAPTAFPGRNVPGPLAGLLAGGAGLPAARLALDAAAFGPGPDPLRPAPARGLTSNGHHASTAPARGLEGTGKRAGIRSRLS